VYYTGKSLGASNMNKEQNRSTVEKVIAIVKLHLNVKRGFDTSSTFVSLGADSLDEIEMLMQLEEDFDIEITDKQAELFNTTDDVVKYLMSIKV
jgi:acyl carrier protein